MRMRLFKKKIKQALRMHEEIFGKPPCSYKELVVKARADAEKKNKKSEATGEK